VTGVPLALAAPAKLNLSLRVVGRRDDGFHELDGLMALVGLADELVLLPGCAGLRLSGRADPAVPVSPAENLAWHGLRAGLGEEPMDCCLALEKAIPARAGLGGGSSDAAAGWRLGRRWRGEPEVPDADDLVELAAIGADVPFFAAGPAVARVRGIGERIEPAALPEGGSEVLLLHPPFGLDTAAVFAELRPSDWSETSDAPPPPGGNDLLAAALRLRPEIADLVRLALSAGVEPHLTGSGPTLYARSDDAERIAAAARRLERAGVRTSVTRLRPEPATIEVMAGTHEEEP